MNKFNAMRGVSDVSEHLLNVDDYPPVMVMNQQSVSPFVFCCDHAGAEIPAQLCDLGVSKQDLDDHIAIDSGIFATTCWIAASIGAPLVAQPISRLVIDCNRKPEHPSSIRTKYDGRAIPGNIDISDKERKKRSDEILDPYQLALGEVLSNSSLRNGINPILVAMHSFSRMYENKRRNCDVGVIYSGQQSFADTLLGELMDTDELSIQHNEPYEIDFEGDFTLPYHTDHGVRPYVELEICQDLISTCAGQRRIARILRRAFLTAIEKYSPN